MFIQTEATRDPATMKFLPGQEVHPGQPLVISDRRQAALSPLATDLFEVDGVTALTFGPDYIRVTKGQGDWQHLKPMLLGVIMDHFMSGAPILFDQVEQGAGSTDAGTLPARIKHALRKVIDPELGYNIVDLGLIYDVSVDADGTASVTMTTTTPGCPATNYLVEGARECTSSVEGVEMAEITLTHEPRWSPDLMSDDAKTHFGID